MALDPTLYNGAPLEPQNVPSKYNAPVAVPEQGADVPLEAVLSTTQGAQQSLVARTAASQPKADVAEVAEAAANNWITSGVFKAMTQPTYEADDVKASDFLMHSTLGPLTKDEMEFFQKGNGSKSFQHRANVIEEDRKGAAAMASRPAVAAVVSGIDPIMWAIPVGPVAGVARVGGGAVVKAATGAGTAFALSEIAATQRPTSDMEVFLGTVLEGLASPMVKAGPARKVVSEGKLVEVRAPVQVDPDFPAAELKATFKAPPPVEAPAFGAHATSDMGDIMLTESAKAPGQFQLTHFADNMPVEDRLFKTKEEAIEAFYDAVDMDGATIAQKSWDDAADTLTIEIPKKGKKEKDVVMYEDIGLAPEPKAPKGLAPFQANDPAVTQIAVEKLEENAAKGLAERVGDSIQWNIRKTMAAFGETHSKISDTLFDNNSNLRSTSVESHIRGVKAELSVGMQHFDNMLRDAMAEDGYGMLKQIFSSKAAGAQRDIEKQVSMEMLRRDQFVRQGRTITHEGVPPRITVMADALDRVAKKSLDELQAAEVFGSEELKHTSGWASRKWDSLAIDQAIDKIKSYGHDAKKAKKMLVDVVARSIADANKIEWETAWDIAHSTIDRALRKGAFEDAGFDMAKGADSAKRIRDMLIADGLTGQRLQRVMDVLVGKQDEAGKAGFLKHRMDLDYTTNLNLGDHNINITDLFDHNIKGTFDKYISRTSAEVGFARKGLTKSSDIEALRKEGIEALKGNQAKQEEFVKLFDGTIAHMFGNAVGADIGQGLRNLAAVNRLTSLGSSGLWQLTEYAKLMQQYGALKTIKYAMAEMPGFRQMMDATKGDKLLSTQLKNVLENASNESIRLQAYVQRYADGFEMPANATLSARLQHSTQLVPYFNGMKWIHAHQARIAANLVVDSLQMAVKGDVKMAKQLEKYGMTPDHLAVLKQDVAQHGLDVEKWSDQAWQKARPTFMKMMDEGVLHARLGDTPAFALLNPVGKFLYTYRGFMLAAHNKLLAGTTARDGFAGVGMMMAYQYPLSAMAVSLQNTIAGKKPLTEKELAVHAAAQMGSMGFLTDILGIVTGTKQHFGAPGLLPVDRAFALGGEISKKVKGADNNAQLGHAAFQVVPFLSILPPARAMEALTINEAKENQPKKARQ